MAKAAWCTVTPTSGKENGTINISAAVHTGRLPRRTTVSVTAVNGTRTKADITVSQVESALSLVKVTGPTPATIPAAGGTVVVTGKSNTMTVELAGRESLPRPFSMNAGEFKANGILQTNGWDNPGNPCFTIDGDPGAAAEYSFESKIIIPANPYPVPRYIEITYTGMSSLKPPTYKNMTVDIKQEASASTLSANKSSIPLVNAGTAQPVVITSNDEWVVS